jgi:hypothetical protein
LAKRSINNEYSFNHSRRNHVGEKIKDAAIRTIAFGAGIMLVASIPLWGIIFKKGE